MSHPEKLIEQVCEFLSSHIHEVDTLGEVDDRLLRCCDFIESLCKELPQLDVTDMRHTVKPLPFLEEMRLLYLFHKESTSVLLLYFQLL